MENDKHKKRGIENKILRSVTDVIRVPRLEAKDTELIIAKWHMNIGDYIEKGDVIAELETDRMIVELESYQTGVLLYKGIEDGGKMKINEILAVIGNCKREN